MQTSTSSREPLFYADNIACCSMSYCHGRMNHFLPVSAFFLPYSNSARFSAHGGGEPEQSRILAGNHPHACADAVRCRVGAARRRFQRTGSIQHRPPRFFGPACCTDPRACIRNSGAQVQGKASKLAPPRPTGAPRRLHPGACVGGEGVRAAGAGSRRKQHARAPACRRSAPQPHRSRTKASCRTRTWTCIMHVQSTAYRGQIPCMPTARHAAQLAPTGRRPSPSAASAWVPVVARRVLLGKLLAPPRGAGRGHPGIQPRIPTASTQRMPPTNALRRTACITPENPGAGSRPTPLPEMPKRQQRAAFVQQLEACIRIPSVRLPRTMRRLEMQGRGLRMLYLDDNNRISCCLPCANSACPYDAVCGQYVVGTSTDTHDRHRCSGARAGICRASQQQSEKRKNFRYAIGVMFAASLPKPGLHASDSPGTNRPTSRSASRPPQGRVTRLRAAGIHVTRLHSMPRRLCQCPVAQVPDTVSPRLARS